MSGHIKVVGPMFRPAQVMSVKVCFSAKWESSSVSLLSECCRYWSGPSRPHHCNCKRSERLLVESTHGLQRCDLGVHSTLCSFRFKNLLTLFQFEKWQKSHCARDSCLYCYHTGDDSHADKRMYRILVLFLREFSKCHFSWTAPKLKMQSLKNIYGLGFLFHSGTSKELQKVVLSPYLFSQFLSNMHIVRSVTGA